MEFVRHLKGGIDKEDKKYVWYGIAFKKKDN